MVQPAMTSRFHLSPCQGLETWQLFLPRAKPAQQIRPCLLADLHARPYILECNAAPSEHDPALQEQARSVHAVNLRKASEKRLEPFQFPARTLCFAKGTNMDVSRCGVVRVTRADCPVKSGQKSTSVTKVG